MARRGGRPRVETGGYESDDLSSVGSEGSWPDPHTFLSQSFSLNTRANGTVSGGGDDGARITGTREIERALGVSTPRSSKVRVHKSGSVSVVSDDGGLTTTITPRHAHGRSAKLQLLDGTRSFSDGSWRHRDESLYENLDVGNFYDEDDADYNSQGRLASNWKSAMAVSSLHRAYSRTVNDNSKLKSALAASEQRCAELLRCSNSEGDVLVPVVSASRSIKLEFTDVRRQLEALKRQNSSQDAELLGIREELRREKAEKLELMRWKSERVAFESMLVE